MPAQQPPVVRAATVLIVVSAVLTVAQAVSTLTNIGSIDTVNALNQALSTGWGKSSNISIATLEEALRIVANVSAVLAAAVGVLAIFARTGSRQARVGLAVLALPVLIACLMSGGYGGVGMLVGIGLLWTRNARSWFAVESSGMPAAPSFAAPAGGIAAATVIGGPPTPPPPVTVPINRPSRVSVAAAVAIVLSAVAAMGGLLGGIGLAMLRDRSDMRQSVIDRLHQDHITLSAADLDRYLTAATVAAVVIAVLGLLGVLAGALVLRRSPQGRIALIALSVVCAVISLISITTIISVVWFAGALVVIFGLRSADSAAWFRKR